jgi:phosphonate transport system substrate-binding protein
MFRRMFLKSAAVAALALPLAAVAQVQKEVNFGIISTDSSINLRPDWQPFLDEMQKRTGLKINAFFASDYAGIIEAMRYNKVQVAWFGNKSAIEAVERANGEVFAQKVESSGAGGYHSVLIVHKDSPYKTLDDVLKNGKSMSFGNGDPNSTSGFLVPSYYVFAQNKIDAKTHFKIVRSANHGTNALAVVNKQVDVATNNTDDLARLKDKSPEAWNNLRVIWESPLIPADPIVWRKDLAEDTKAKIKTFLVGWGKDEQERTITGKALKARGFRESSNAQLVPIRQLELFRDRTKLEEDASLAAGEKAAKIAEIDRKLSELNRQLASR